MNPSSSPSPLSPSADAAAALWAARLEGSTLDVADRHALEAWLAADPSHRALLSGYCQFSADLELQLPALFAAGRVTMPPSAPRARRWSFPLLTASAAAAFAAVIFTVSFIRHYPAAPESISTVAAQRHTVTLADGTTVELNARTSLQVELTRTGRRVRLADGEAFFTVAKDPTRPFTVETPAGSVRVTGTIFNVRVESAAAFEVTVAAGSVQVRPGDTAGGQASAPPATLVAGDHLSARASRGVTVEKLSTDALDDVLAWRQGKIVFDAMPLGEALARFARHHGRPISVSGAASVLPISGPFSIDDLDGFLDGLTDGVLRVRVTRETGGAVRISLPTER